jgi:exonuclease VII small subunit
MDLHKIIAELQSEKDRLDEAILALERLSTVVPKGKKRGRPPLQKQPQQIKDSGAPHEPRG